MALASFVVTIAAVWLILMAQGVSSYAAVYSVVLSQLGARWQRLWHSSLYLGLVSIPWALGGLAASIVFARRVAREPGNAYKLLAPVKLVFAGIALLLPGTSLPGFVTPYCWLVLYAPSGDAQLEQAFPRFLLAAAAVLQTLYAFPFGRQPGAFYPDFAGCCGSSIDRRLSIRGKSIFSNGHHKP